MGKDELIKLLFEALTAAEAHLEYCNYGDSWERECAISSGLPDQISEALKALKIYDKGENHG